MPKTMKKVLTFLVFVILHYDVRTAVVQKITHSEGYYWRDYHNRFPSDAVAAGNDRDGTPMYIAQVLYRDMLIPGTIGKNQSHVVFEYGTQKLTASENIKILCTNFPKFLNWIDTDTFLFLINDDYIVGGHEKNYKVFIGRAIHNGRWLIGKVIVIDGSPTALHTIEDEQSIRLPMFQVLGFSSILVNSAAIANVISNPPKVINELYYTDAYYWRDFDNHIPFDAFSAGNDKAMLPIYIGQILHIGSLFPGNLDILKKETYENTTKGFVKKNNIKILCSNYPQYLEWKRIDDPKMLINKNVIVGGYEKPNLVYIGRGVSKDEIVVGKLVPINGRYQLDSVQNDKIVRLQSYETLVVKQIGSDVTATTESSETFFTTANSGIVESPTPSVTPEDHYNGNGSVSKTVIINHHYYNVSDQPSKCEKRTVIINIY